MNTKPLDIIKLSKHIFWDVDPENLTFEKNAELIVGRVLDYGLIDDWKLLHNSLGIREIAKIAMNIKDLDIKSANFVAQLADVPLEKFKCYTTRQSMRTHWVY